MSAGKVVSAILYWAESDLSFTILPQSEIIMFYLHLDSYPSTHSAASTASVPKGATASSKPQAVSKPRMFRLIKYSSVKSSYIGSIIQTLLYDGLSLLSYY